ncbi:phosphohistidine phosphatase SixA [Desulfitobacterium hafniense]|uniref:phosphohistidine phosphatase SixA n=1 Tax=Desulfitobacterium hafniense TaxID=49338 RepID=UPI00036CA433|nr:phosphohistidine phosphatase SixA [Desulfitobacterium hafniense]
MELILMRHGQAEENMENDAERTLTKEGQKKIKRVAFGIDHLLDGKKKICIWTSPLERAWQTAQIIAKKLNVAEVEKVELLATGGDLMALLEEWLPQKQADCLIIVGHQPYLSDWSVKLAATPLPFKKGAIAGYKLNEESPLTAQLRWFVQPGVWSK